MDKDDEKLDIELEAAPTLGGDGDRYEAKTGIPYEDIKKDEPEPDYGGIKIPSDALKTSSGSPAVLIAILFAAAILICGVAFAIAKNYTVAGILAGVFVVYLITFFIVLSVSEKRALSGESVLGKAGTVLVTARVKSCYVHSKSERVHRTNGYISGREVVSVVYKVILRADGKDFTALSKNYYKENERVKAYVNGKKAFIDDGE